eukprot:EG_transcript_19471
MSRVEAFVMPTQRSHVYRATGRAWEGRKWASDVYVLSPSQWHAIGAKHCFRGQTTARFRFVMHPELQAMCCQFSMGLVGGGGLNAGYIPAAPGVGQQSLSVWWPNERPQCVTCGPPLGSNIPLECAHKARLCGEQCAIVEINAIGKDGQAC